MKRILLLFTALILLPIIGYSQTTGATIEGTVITVEGRPLPGANVVAIHQPTGSRYGTSTLSNGSYTLNSVRVGGPYIIKVTFVGFNAAKKELADIDLGETIEVNFKLQQGSVTLEELTVVGNVNTVFNENVTGAKTHISTVEISRVPTLDRTLQDFLQLSPYASGGFSFGGANDRYNSLLIDGATLDDVFGLGNATPGSQAGVGSPISIDAIAEFNVALAPFGVKNSGFTGAQINAVTRSGTNEYSGSLYYYTRNEAFSGRYVQENGTLSPELDAFQQRFIGLRVGGPIVTDELFFFVSAEIKRESFPLITPIGIFGQDAFPVDASVFQEISQIAQNQYGYDPGGYGNPLEIRQDNYKILTKINWNINPDNKFMFRYNYLNATDEEGISRSSGGYSFANRQYNFNSRLHSFVAELNTNLNSRMFNTLRVVYTRIRDTRDVVDEPFPLVNISYPVNPADFDFRPIFLGIDRFSQKNQLFQDLIEITDNIIYIRGDHEFTFGTSNKIYFFNNLFVQDAFGTYEFQGRDGDTPVENFRQGDPYSYQVSYLLPGGNPRAKFSVLQFGLYAQDRYTVNDRLTITLGLRVDVPFMPDEPSFNPEIPEAFPGYTTSRVASGNPLWSPRFGFNWDLSTDDTITQIRGGIGIFSGPPPVVWISNQYSNTGVDYARLRIFDPAILTEGFFSPDPTNQPTAASNPNIQIETSAVNLISEDFKYPQTLKFNLAIDQELPYGVSATLEGIYSNAINAVTFKNLNIEPIGTAAHGRPIYSNNLGPFEYQTRYVHEQFTNVILLENTDKGYGYSISAQLQKQFYSGLYMNVSYTYNIQKRVNSGNSSRAISNWQFNESVDPNNPQLAITDYNRRHRFLANVAYQFDYLDGFSTTFSVILDTHSGSPFSWIYFGNANGDTQPFNDLVYVPEVPGVDGDFDDVVLVSGNPRALNAFINSHPSLYKNRGEFVEANNATTPWETFLDLSMIQRIPTFEGQSLELSLNMINVLNFINDNWGTREFIRFGTKTAWTILDYTDQGLPVIAFDPFRAYRSNLYETAEIASRWRLQLGLRYNF